MFLQTHIYKKDPHLNTDEMVMMMKMEMKIVDWLAVEQTEFYGCKEHDTV